MNGSRIEVKLATPPKREADESPHRSRKESTSTDTSAATWSTTARNLTLTPTTMHSALANVGRSLLGPGVPATTTQIDSQAFTRLLERSCSQTQTQAGSYTAANNLSLLPLLTASGPLTLSALASELSAGPAGPSALPSFSLLPPATNGVPLGGELAFGSLPLMQSLQAKGTSTMQNVTGIGLQQLYQQLLQSSNRPEYERLPSKGLGLSAIAVNGPAILPKSRPTSEYLQAQLQLPKLSAPYTLAESKPPAVSVPQTSTASLLGQLKNLNGAEATQLLNALQAFIAAKAAQSQASAAESYPLGTRPTTSAGAVGQLPAARHEVLDSLFPGRYH